MKNVLGFVFLISIIASIILFFVCICNYLIAYNTTGEQLKEALMNNVYVRYWITLLAFSVGVLVISFIGYLLVKPKAKEDGYQVYNSSRRVVGSNPNPVDEYVTVRVKRDELSKLKS